ncbi:occludin/ELL domain-containing protein 1 [Tyto alba]|uniref:occludin/ELL domain-containing protein 1 n=1 Tax=Tyto alba TaxID=56313 RepID=UPI001C66DC37|nr:occludin/ELL domain-containing protein 1 [Tyto alba]
MSLLLSPPPFAKPKPGCGAGALQKGWEHRELSGLAPIPAHLGVSPPVELSPAVGERSSRRGPPGAPHHPKAAGSRRPSPPTPPESRLPPARARHVVFEDEVVPVGRPPGRLPPAKKGEKSGARTIPPGLAPRPHAVPDYVVKYPAIRSPWQREGYKGVFQDQLAEYTELLGEIRAGRPRPRELEAAMGWWPRHAASRTDESRVTHVWHVRKKMDLALLEKQQRCEYLKKKLTHIKARIQEYDRAARAGYF